MNGFSGNKASGAFEKPDGGEAVLTLTTARRMLPLVRQIVVDVLHARRMRAGLQPEANRLDRQRHDLSWPERARRYQVQEEIAATERLLELALSELGKLGLALVRDEDGWVGFPTIVNGRKAFFSWKPGEETLKFWHFAGETVRRLIPATWLKVDEASLTGKN
jgi:hypothetical protein